MSLRSARTSITANGDVFERIWTRRLRSLAVESKLQVRERESTQYLDALAAIDAAAPAAARSGGEPSALDQGAFRGASSTSRTFRVKVSGVIGFCRKATSESSTP